MSYTHTRSCSGGCRVAVWEVEVSAPKCGNVEETPQSWAGVMAARWTARVSPGSASSTKNGPDTGFRYGIWHTCEGRSAGLRTRPPKQSSVCTCRMSPERTWATGIRPPKV
ncbi:hypothetical protein Xph01_48030 [Micromonospora phaseoli]|nr:hypothetical protein Xph01_48030 [Micromonospora phaseoli]